jgi:hypothetical protein
MFFVLQFYTHPLLLVQFMHVPISQRFVLHFIDIFLDILDPKQTKQRKHHQPANTKKKKRKSQFILSPHPRLCPPTKNHTTTTTFHPNNVRHIKPFVLLRLHFPMHPRAMVLFQNAPTTIVGRIRPSIDGMAGRFIVPLGTHIVAGQVPVQHRVGGGGRGRGGGRGGGGGGRGRSKTPEADKKQTKRQ